MPFEAPTKGYEAFHAAYDPATGEFSTCMVGFGNTSHAVEVETVGRWPFKMYKLADRPEAIAFAKFAGWREVYREYAWLGGYYAPRPWVYWLRFRHKWLRHQLGRAYRVLWPLGLLEPAEFRPFSLRQDFRPFPWRGRRRLKEAKHAV